MKVRRSPPVFEDSSLVLLAQVYDTNGVPMTQAVVSAIALSVCDLADPKNPIASTNLAPVSNYVYNTLQTNEVLWKEDDQGFNFKYVTLPGHLKHGDRTYRFDVRITFTDGGVVHCPWDVPSLNLLIS